MTNVLLWLGRIAGIAGALISVVAVMVRLSGRYWLGGFQVGTLLQAGMAAMLLACLCLLATLTARMDTRRH